MPTRPLLLLLLAPLAPAVGAEPSGTFAPAFDRMRGGAVSAGPQGLPRRVDKAVEPASFEVFEVPKPLKSVAPPSAEPIVEPEHQAIATPTPPGEAETEESAPAPPLEASDVRPETAPDDGKRKLPLGGDARPEPGARSARLPDNPLKALAQWRPSTESLTATGAGLAIAVGLVLSFVWLARSCLPKSARPLPRDVVEVLGRAPLGGKQTTQLVRVGGKLLLVATTPEGAETLTEITDPDEVARLVAACDSSRGRGSNAEFDALLREMADERTTPGFLDRGGPAEGSFDPRSLAAAYANTPGGRGDG